MAKNERKRTMVYSNVNKRKGKKADKKSASNSDDIIDLDNEIVIGLASFPKPEGAKKLMENQEKNKSGQPVKRKLFNFGKRKNNNVEEDTFIGENRNKESEGKNIKITKKVVFDKEKNIQPKISKQERIKMQKRRAIKRMSACLLLCLLLIGATTYFFLSSVFNIKTINVENNSHVSSEQIIDLSEINLNINTFRFSKKESKKRIMSNPYVENVDINRNIFTGTVKILVKERVPTLMLSYGNNYAYINNQGYILEISGVTKNVPIIKGYVTSLEEIKPGNRLNKDDLERLEVVLNIMEEANSKGIGNLITYIDIKDKRNYAIILESEDKTVYLGDGNNLPAKMLYIPKMLEKEKGIEGEFFLNVDLNIKEPMFRERV